MCAGCQFGCADCKEFTKKSQTEEWKPVTEKMEDEKKTAATVQADNVKRAEKTGEEGKGSEKKDEEAQKSKCKQSFNDLKSGGS
jgi:hypothetical protein